MIDIVIPLAESKTNFLDLRYALRSLDKFTEHGKVYLIGAKPDWVQGIEHISMNDLEGKEWKELSIRNKVEMAFHVLSEFLFMNDDHIFLEETDIANYPDYYKGTCYESMLKNNSHYRQTMNQTRKWLASKGFADINFDGHCPMIFKVDEFNRIDADWTKQFGYGLKSLYAAGRKGVYMEDKKLHRHLTFIEARAACMGRHVISCTDAAIKTGLGEYLNELLPLKSKYER